MTDENHRQQSRPSVCRRTVLAGVAAGVTTLAGCGYRPGKGDTKWRQEVNAEEIEFVLDDFVVAVDDNWPHNHAWEIENESRDPTDASGELEFYALESGEHESIRFEAALGAAATDGTVCYVTEAGGAVRSAVNTSDPDDGQAEFERERLGKVWNPNVAMDASDGIVYLVSESGEITGMATDGTGKWNERLETRPAELPRVSAGPNGVVIEYDSERGQHLVGYGPDGRLGWRREWTGERFFDPVLANGEVYLVGDTFEILDASNGQTLTTLEIVSQGAPVLGPHRETIYLSGGELTKVDLLDREVAWTVEGTTGRPATDGTVVYVPERGRLVELDAETGSVRWEQSGLDVDDVLAITDELVISIAGYGDDLEARYR